MSSSRSRSTSEKKFRPHLAFDYTHLLEAGISPGQIQQRYLSHTSLQTTMIYLHLTHTAAVDACRD
ncbi:MAG: hypothetical protein R3C17_16045 [Planctomycetaceae bacterium]